jgi:hypothetical protein
MITAVEGAMNTVIGIAALILLLLPTTGARASANLNCDAYAATAVAQNQQNENFKCGFTGSAWSSDFNAHRTWCLAPTTTMQNGGNIAAMDAAIGKASQEVWDGGGRLMVFEIVPAIEGRPKYPEQAKSSRRRADCHS